MKTKRILMSFIGVLLCSISVGLFKFAALGVDPFQSLMSGIDSLGLLNFGTMYVIANAVLLGFALLFDRRLIGLGTFLNMFLLGYAADFTQKLLLWLIPEPSLWLRGLCMLLALPLTAFSVSLVMTADLGVSTYDAVAIVLSNKTPIPFRFCRILSDTVCVIGGCAVFLLGGGIWTKIFQFAGIATLLTAFCTGPLVDMFNRLVSRPLLFGKKQ